jgi:hypothetical protein
MRPPECDLCGAAADELLTFATTPEGAAWHARSAADGLPGHPPDAHWLCTTHLEPLRPLRHLTWHEARERTRPRPRTVDAIAHALIDRLPDLLHRLGGPAGQPAPSPRSERSWTPMDGAQPPWCPFTDRLTAELASDGWRLQVECTRNHWNDEEVANANVSLTVQRGPLLLIVSGYGDGAIVEGPLHVRPIRGDDDGSAEAALTAWLADGDAVGAGDKPTPTAPGDGQGVTEASRS